MRTLIYKRTHSGDPSPETGVFGNNGCMGKVRSWQFEAVIDIGGTGREPEVNGIARKLTWVGIGPHKVFDDALRPECPRVTFDHFLYYGEKGRLLIEIAPALARRMYGKNVRVLMNSLSAEERREVEAILQLAKKAPPSSRPSKRRSRSTAGKSRSNLCR
jgi:hypothetical protein